ncbi:MAG: hypothetical protein GWN71_04385, partial [Gammaproteobacteria bacterium]|nr:hypothetical protein [Gemmatimonadota bacterium]NIU72835.1 hypothetical protein [Gammaproteobacteria bacterium]NIY07377.1 hypothetical protein [Gemmatimonadota bacterium]
MERSVGDAGRGRSSDGRGRFGVEAARLVHHASGAGDDAAVLRLAPAAAEEAARLGAHREAAAHYE